MWPIHGDVRHAAGLGTVSLIPLPTCLLQVGDAQRPGCSTSATRQAPHVRPEPRLRPHHPGPRRHPARRPMTRATRPPAAGRGSRSHKAQADTERLRGLAHLVERFRRGVAGQLAPARRAIRVGRLAFGVQALEGEAAPRASAPGAGLGGLPGTRVHASRLIRKASRRLAAVKGAELAAVVAPQLCRQAAVAGMAPSPWSAVLAALATAGRPGARPPLW
jgi:hypothetical protein